MSHPSDHHEPEEHPHRRAERFVRIRRMKALLKYMPRRAVMHKYPLVGRFAEFARRRAYLWSFKPEAMRPALYAGSILSLLPVMGAQIPLALVLALLLRANFMVMGGLQLITNPFTVAPIYLATYQLGAWVIETAGFDAAAPTMMPHESMLSLAEHAAPAADPALAPAHTESGVRRVATAFNALILGGVLAGLALGLVLDILYRNYWEHHIHATPRRRRQRPAPDAPPAGPPA